MSHAVRSSVNEDIIDELNKVINMDYDAVKIYETAIDRLHSRSYKDRLESFRKDHIRHIQVLAPIVSEYGGEPASQSEVKSVLTQNRVVVGNIVGDQSVIKAMNCNERATNEQYEQTIRKLAAKPDLARVLEENLEDERRHKQWLEQTLKAM